MRARCPGLVLGLCVAAGAPPLGAQTGRPVALVGGTLMDGRGGDPVPGAVVLMRGDTILAAGAMGRVGIPHDAEVIDVAGLTILPGLIDGHVHVGLEAFVGAPVPLDSVLSAALAAGITTLVDLGNAHPWVLALRDSLERGQRRGPRLLAAGAMITAPGGHPAGTWLRGRPEAVSLGTRQVTTPEQARAAVEGLGADGVDVIKAVYDGGSRRSPFGLVPKLDREALIAAVAAAKDRGVPAYVHWQHEQDLADVLLSRPDVLVHLSIGPLSDDAIQAIATSGVIVQPTLAAVAGFLPGAVFEQLYLANVVRLVRAGVRLTAGTDAPLGPQVGEGLYRELELLIRAGLSPAQAIRAATTTAADALGRSDLGRVIPGARADVLVVAGDPRGDLAALREIRVVVSAGRVVVR
jgi:enamidase